ncbi:MAG: AraC family transcriptional regulator ligand-binding domain-containing protein [Bacteroidota bacterium]|nr:AraC family transcriptional regulator ligand-binding domain-containing protein [Bacteroidota bacterium]
MKYTAVSLYRKMIVCALAEGMQVDYFNELKTPYSSLDTVKAVPAEEFFELHELLDAELGPGFSIRVGQQMKIEDYGVLGLSWRTCSYVGEIFERSERYFKMLSNTYVFKVEKNKEYSVIHLMRELHRRGLELSNEATLSATVVVLQAMTESHISPTQVSFKHSPPNDLSSYTNVFDCPILFDQPHYSITYSSSDFQMRTAKADSSINKFLVERVEEETKGLEISANKVAMDCERLIQDALPSGIPSIHQIGALMGMSNRTLARRLADNGITFRDLIRKTQEGISKDLLKHTERSIAEIAFETGFSEQSAFNRAFKRWTGITPIEFRNTP